jgi:hypothetical protein
MHMPALNSPMSDPPVSPVIGVKKSFIVLSLISFVVCLLLFVCLFSWLLFFMRQNSDARANLWPLRGHKNKNFVRVPHTTVVKKRKGPCVCRCGVDNKLVCIAHIISSQRQKVSLF